MNLFVVFTMQAIMVLYELGFPVIGQVHTGNVFKVDKDYVLGGFENALLGYRTSRYADIKGGGLLDCIDVIMLGKYMLLSETHYLLEGQLAVDIRGTLKKL